MQLLQGIQATSGALDAEKVRMDLIAQNIANAYTTKTEEGTPYKRKTVTFESYMIDEGSKINDNKHLNQGVKVGEIVEDEKLGVFIYNPNHPHANKEGMVEMPNVDVSREMVDLIMASRSYEANLSVVKTSRQMAMQALNIGR